MREVAVFSLAVLAMVWASGPVVAPLTVVSREFIYERAPFPSAHASTIVETPNGLVAAWFGGTREKNPDVGIWLSRRAAGKGSAWTEPKEVANGVQADRERFPTWNPVLVEIPVGAQGLPPRSPDSEGDRAEASPLLLFYKVGPSPSEWWAMVMGSDDGGVTWTAARRLPEGILGPIRAKPLWLEDGSLLAGSSTEDHGWVVHMERLSPIRAGIGDQGSGIGKSTAEAWVEWIASAAAWTKTGPLNSKKEFDAIQPTILQHSATRFQILCRTQQDVIAEAWSEDGGRTWTPMRATTLPNPSAGIDSVKLPDGRFLLAYNPSSKNRQQLAVAISSDGTQWSDPFIAEDGPGEYSYPALIVTDDGLVHLTYTWRRERIRHVVLQVD
jgi:predicted neuraminidase